MFGKPDQFVAQLRELGATLVRYWQCDNEPSNLGLTWAGTAATTSTCSTCTCTGSAHPDPRLPLIG